MITGSARRAKIIVADEPEQVFARAVLLSMPGCTASRLRANLAARRWQRVGRAIVVHDGPLTRQEQWRVTLINCGARAVLTSFTGLQSLGLAGWERDEVHALAVAGVPQPRLPFPVVLHRTASWTDDELWPARRLHRPAPAAVLAASGFRAPRPACGLLAATVQQRLVRAEELRRALTGAPRVRHRRALLAAVDDIAMGAQALGEIDFVRLCRRHGLPEPTLQRVRAEPGGRRRYLDAEWTLRGGRTVAVEVDGAVHLAPTRWFADQLRQNELVLAGTTVLRYPSVVVREEPALVVGQLCRALSH